MEKQRQEALEWFVQFANMNLNELRPGDKAKLIVESEEYLFPTKEVKDLQFGPKAAQQVMAWAFKEPPPRESEEYWSTILHLQDIVKRTLYMLAEKAPIPGKAFDYAFQTGARVWTVMVRSEWNHEKFIFSYIPLAKSQDDYIQIKLHLLLNGLPRSNFQRCLAPKCGKYFVNVSLRKKRFCSPRCLWRFNAEKRRKADPEGYKEYQKQLMKDRYREEKGHRRLKTKPRKTRKEA